MKLRAIVKYQAIGVLAFCIASYGVITHAKTAKTSGSTSTEQSAEVQSTAHYPVNINEADAETLAALPGIGTSRAKAIISYREEHGTFKKVEELANVRGISDAYIEKNKAFLKVN
ncbi:MAG: helix-hairpin-helix protein [Gammaproteobacteria bacterium]|nr:helix-hairpin-helix protein [Gammaproteobacteria bacterium]